MTSSLTWIFSALMAAAAVPEAARANEAALPRSAPETQGVSSRALLAFVEAADKLGVTHSFMLVRHGHVVAEGYWEPYERDTVHEVYSGHQELHVDRCGPRAERGQAVSRDARARHLH